MGKDCGWLLLRSILFSKYSAVGSISRFFHFFVCVCVRDVYAWIYKYKLKNQIIMATNSDALHEDRPQRTFVFVSAIHPSLLRPVDLQQSVGASSRKSRDPRYEALRKFLSDRTTGLMQVLHLEDPSAPYALGLYADTTQALAACTADMSGDTSETQGQNMLTLRILKTSMPKGADEVFHDTIIIDGATVPKGRLAPTRGLVAAYRGTCVPKWCPKTKEQVDCPFGFQCRFIHDKEFQQTQKRRRMEGAEAGNSSSLSPRTAMEISELAQVALRAAHKALDDVGCLGVVDLSQADAAVLLRFAKGSSDDVEVDSVKQRIASVLASRGTSCDKIPIFAKFLGGAPHGAPWDWALYDNDCLRELRRVCPMASNGNPTPLERDRFCERLLLALNERCNRFGSVSDDALAIVTGEAWCQHVADRVVTALARSPRTVATLEHAAQQPQGRRDATPLQISLERWVRIASVLHEVTFMFREGGVLAAVVQRRGNVRYCSRDDGEDVARRLSIPTQRAAEALSHALANAPNHLSRLSLAIHCAIVEPKEESSSNGQNQQDCAVVFLSCKDFDSEADASCVFVDQQNESAAARQPKTLYNTTKHFNYPLFARDVLERLKTL